ncbi:hypothetical protein FML64_18735 [Klebsiella quasipneumoniae]|uniref:Uncharacterized protein n=1 Tax=Klebsiella quasipneumoniae TaxID=1463165 RepID=A0AAI8NM95_9ENTR|nr:hypothetical protein DKC11_12010 [Klebsiella quasipneumoniae]AWX89816.1 hypothetical protein DP204_26235 [Klebsiella quasipneumoniae subsp. quasipneumoniae]AWL64089.1 hypothetical protein DKC00_21165 [Klebsiella quasipneumoniae]AWL74459.1 hypothetical protein DKC09_15685 [Klebsiella quasipneumoniae]AZA44491.1 hypothetical protein EB840_15570 [Klebsiella quasipneumoniae]
MGIILYSVKHLSASVPDGAALIRPTDCVGRIRHSCRHPARTLQHYLVIRLWASFSAASTV